MEIGLDWRARFAVHYHYTPFAQKIPAHLVAPRRYDKSERHTPSLFQTCPNHPV